jgi:flagellar motility protein MotE (MotC chaperone)
MPNILRNKKPSCWTKQQYWATNGSGATNPDGPHCGPGKLRHALSLLLCVLLCCGFGLATAKAADDKAPQAPAISPLKLYDSVEERRIMESLRTGGASPLAREQAELDRKKNELKRLEAEVDKKIEQLGRLRAQIEQLLAAKGEEEEKRTMELAKMYEKMTAEQAAKVLSNVDQELAIAILGKMKTKSAARVLDKMDRSKAATLTTAFSTLNIR